MLKYQIALTNAIFDDTYRNVLRFDTRAEQEAYFNVNTLFANAVNCNFNVGSLYATKVVVDFKDNNVDLNELMNNNYCIVKDNSENAIIKYYYYFVKSAQQECGNRLICDLELDVYQTYYIDITFDDCAILRAHLNRFIDNGDNTVSFDSTPSSKLFEREDVQDLPKRLIKRNKIQLSNNSYYNQNIVAWLYMYLDPTHPFKWDTPDGNETTLSDIRLTYGDGGVLPTNMSVLALPIVKRQNAPMFVDTHSGTTIPNGRWYASKFLQNFELKNNGYSNVFSIKISLTPPGLNYNSYTNNINVNSGGSLNYFTFLDNENIGNGIIVGCGTDENGYQCRGLLLSLKSLESIENGIDIEITDKKLVFNKNEIVGANASPIFNPKLLNGDYLDIRLVDYSGDNFGYDLQKFGTNTTRLIISEALTPDFSKVYARLKPPANNTLYVAETTKNLLGLITTNDSSLLMPTSAYNTMLANNKNYFAQAQFNRTLDLVKGGAQAITNAAGENFAGALKSSASFVIEYISSVKNQNYEIDNLRNAPGAVKGASGNFIFNALCDKPGYYIEEYDITENSKKAVNDYMMRYGFNYNRIDNIKNVDNIRKNYNYVQAYIEEIKTGLVNISNIVHNKLREIFARGVRMWNARTFDYTKENYERWLEQ